MAQDNTPITNKDELRLVPHPDANEIGPVFIPAPESLPPLPPKAYLPDLPLFPRVVIESPLRGRVPAWVPLWLAPWVERIVRASNRRYARACMWDSIQRHEAPYASHLLLDQPGILDDAHETQRGLGIDVGLRWGEAAQVRAVYCDKGISGGMQQGVLSAPADQRIEYRWLYERRDPQTAEEVQRIRRRLEVKRGRS